jgi:hypothetical protein
MSGRGRSISAPRASIWWRRNVEGTAKAVSGDDVYKIISELGLASFLVWCGDLFTINFPNPEKLWRRLGYAPYSMRLLRRRAREGFRFKRS